MKLTRHDLDLEALSEALRKNNRNVGGGYIVRSGEATLVQGVSRTTTTDQVENVVIESHNGVPIRVRDVAEVRVGHAIRRGGVTAEGEGEAVLGTRLHANGRELSRGDQRP